MARRCYCMSSSRRSEAHLVATVPHRQVAEAGVERDELVVARLDQEAARELRMDGQRVDRRAEELFLLDGVDVAERGARGRVPLDDHARRVGRVELRAVKGTRVQKRAGERGVRWAVCGGR